MKHYFSKYPLSWLVILVLLYLSFFTPPKTGLDEVTNFDKFVHICMYFGLCSVIWIEYLRSHRGLHRLRTLVGAVVLPLALSGAIELGQEYLTTTRSGDWADMLANAVGVCLAALVWGKIFRRR